MRLRLDQLAIALLFLCALMIGFCQSGHGQDSIPSGYKTVYIVDSVVFEGNTGFFIIDANTHFKNNGSSVYEHHWAQDGNQRICMRCLRWEVFHTEKIQMYQYSLFYLAKRDALELMRNKK